MNSEVKKNIKELNKLSIIFLIIILILVILLCLSFAKKVIITPSEITTPEEQIFNKCDVGANVFRTECLIKQLDRVSAEREWKQLKIESAKHPQVNKFDLMGEFSDQKEKITNWRVGFEDRRDKWCEAQSSFRIGSGITGDIATCKIELELLAIKNLNYIYYDSILQNISDSAGFLDFEPTPADIDKLIKTNVTQRGSIWVGEEDQLDYTKLSYNQVMDSKFGEGANVDFYKSSYKGQIIRWQAKISAHYSQITGIKFCVIDKDHKNIDIDEPCDLFWAFSGEVMDADIIEKNPKWDGYWVDYILNYYKVPFDQNSRFYDDIYTITGLVGDFDCGIAEKCVPNIDIISIVNN